MVLALIAFQFATAQHVIKLWPNVAPGNNECPQPEETFNGKMVRFVSDPTLTVYLPEKEIISGFSAGGHLASTASTHFDKGKENSTNPIEKVSCRPDFSVLIYLVITFNELWDGFGMNKTGKPHDQWPQMLINWMTAQKIIKYP